MKMPSGSFHPEWVATFKRNMHLRDDIREEIFSEVTQSFEECGLDRRTAEEEADHYINTHNFCNEFAL